MTADPPADRAPGAPGGETLAAERRFPLQVEERSHGSSVYHPFPRHKRFMVPWSVAEVAYEVYAKKYGRQQSLERLAERGGFGEHEFLWLLSGGDDKDMAG